MTISLKMHLSIRSNKIAYKPRFTPANHNKGFSLVEIMIGLVIGLIATLVIVNVFSVFEQQKRATTGNSDAQTNGAIALYNIQREAQLAGFGLPVYDNSLRPYNCGTENDATAVLITRYDHDNNAGTPQIGLSPIVITDGGLNGSDTIGIRYGDTSSGGISVGANFGPNNTANIATNLGCRVGETALIISNDAVSPRCEMRRITIVPNPPPAPALQQIVFTPNTTITTAGTQLACIGAWNEYRYAVNANNELTRSGAIVAGVPTVNPVPVVADIVSLQAQYGVSAVPNSNIVTQWVNATDEWANINNAAMRNRIKAIRVAVVARNGLIEPAAVTAACSSLTAPNPTGLCAWAGNPNSPAPSINLAATDANWARYRYRVYESIIPLRNVIFAGT